MAARFLSRVGPPYLQILFALLLLFACSGRLGAWPMELQRILVVALLITAATLLFRCTPWEEWRNSLLPWSGLAALTSAAIITIHCSQEVVRLCVSSISVAGIFSLATDRGAWRQVFLGTLVAAFIASLVALPAVWMSYVDLCRWQSDLWGRVFLDRAIRAGPSVSGAWGALLIMGFALPWLSKRKRRIFAGLSLLALLWASDGAFIVVTHLFNDVGIPLVSRVRLIHDLSVIALIALWMTCTGASEGASEGRAPEERRAIARRASLTLVAVLCTIVVAGELAALRARAWRLPARVLFYEGDYLGDRTIPNYGKIGLMDVGMFGMLDKYGDLLDVQVTPTDDLSSPDQLGRHDVLLLVNPRHDWTDRERRNVWDFVAAGGSFLVLGDHTDIGGSQSSLNRILEPFGIRFNFDSSYPPRDRWQHSLRVLHGGVCPLLPRTTEIHISVGATLALTGRAFPVISGDFGLADIGSHENEQGAYLGDYRYQVGEELGDVVLVAAAKHGSGRVLVFGDTSSIQNPSLPRTFLPFVVPLLSWLQGDGSSVSEVSHLVVLGGLLILAWLTPRPTLPCVFVLLWIAAWTCISQSLAYARFNEQVCDPARSDRRVAHLDLYHAPALSWAFSDSNHGWGLIANQMRNDLIPLMSRLGEPAVLDRGGSVWIVDPRRSLAPHEVDRLISFMQEGGFLYLAAGYPNKAHVQELLRRFDLDIANIPLGPYPVVRTEAYRGPQFREAWPIQILDSPEGTEPVSPSQNPWRVVVAGYNYPLVVFREFGEGGVFVLGDGRFFEAANLESLHSYNPNNVIFLETITRKLRKPQSR